MKFREIVLDNAEMLPLMAVDDVLLGPEGLLWEIVKVKESEKVPSVVPLLMTWKVPRVLNEGTPTVSGADMPVNVMVASPIDMLLELSELKAPVVV